MSDTIYSYYTAIVPRTVAVEILLSEAQNAKTFERVKYYLTRASQIKNMTPKLDAPNRGDEQRTSRVCIRIDRPAKNFAGEQYTYNVSFSFCSFIDNFHRQRARDIASNRIISPKGNTSVQITSPTRLNARDISERAIQLAFDNPAVVKAPKWFCSTPRSAINVSQRRTRRKHAA